MLEDLRNKIIEQERASSQQHDKKIKANKNNIGAYYISNQHHSLTLTPSKVYSKVSFTEHSFFPRKKFLIDIFVRNGYKKKLLKNLVVECNNKKNNKYNHENNTQTRDYTNLKRLPWILNISPKIKREFKKIGKALPSRRGKNLQRILCQKNKPKLLPNSQPGVYQLDCLCNGKYIGKLKKRVFTRCIEHQQNSMS